MNWIPKIEYTEKGTGAFKTFTFDSPPEGDPFNETFSASSVVKRTNNGRKQTQFNYTRQLYKLEFIFQSTALKDSFSDFMLNHALLGGSFKYYPSSDEVAYETYKSEAKEFKLARPIPNATGDFEYDINLSLERTL